MKFKRKGHVKIIFIFLVFSCILIPEPAFPEDFFKVKKSISENSWKKIGFVYVNPSILLKDIGYHSNIYYFDKNATPDWTADAGLNVTFSALIGKRFILVISESPYYSFYLENKNLQFFNNQTSVTVYSYLGRFNLKYIYSFSSFLTRPTLEFGNRIKTNRFHHEFLLEYGNYNSFFIGVTGRQEDLKYDDTGYFSQYDVRAHFNRSRKSIGITFNKVIFTRTKLFLSTEYFDYQFESDFQKSGKGGLFSIGVKFPEVSILRGDFMLGLKYFVPNDPEVEEYMKPNGSGNVSLRLSKRFKLGLGYIIDNYYSYFQPDQYFDLTKYTVNLSYYVGKNIKAGYSYSVGETEYQNIRGGDTGRIDRTEQSDFRLGIRVSGNMEFGVQFTSYLGVSTSLEFTRKFHFIGGYINHEF